MAWDNAYRARPGDTATAAKLQKLIVNLMYLRGLDSGQTEIDTLAPVLFTDYLVSTNATYFGLKSEWETAINTAEVRFVSEPDTAGTLADGMTVNLSGILGVTGGSEEEFARLAFVRDGESSGKLNIHTRYTANGFDQSGEVLTVTKDGLVGIDFEAPEYAVDIGAGRLDISGDYYLNGVALTDWVLTPGAPDNVSRTGDARVEGSFRTTIADGTAPFVVASTDEATHVSAGLLAGHRWHDGASTLKNRYSKEGSVQNVGTSDTDSSELYIDKAGKWLVIATGEISNAGDADVGRVFSAKIKNAGGTQIGATVEVTTEESPTRTNGYSSEIKTFQICGVYTAAGAETIKTTLALASATDSENFCRTILSAIWLGP